MAKGNETTGASTEAQTQKKPERGGKVESTFAEKWDPRRGDTLAGRYLGSEQAAGRKDDAFTAYQILDDDGRRWSCSGAHLDSLMPQVPIGSYVWLTFSDEKRMKNGVMRLYELEVEKGVTLLKTLK